MAVTEPLHRRTPASRRWDIRLLPDGQDLQRWRHEATAVVEEWGFDKRVKENAALATSELLTNVLRHAGDPRCVLELRKVGCAIFIRVTDHCPTLPVLQEPDVWAATSGRGLWTLQHIVDALHWFNVPRRTGAAKTVWCQIDGHPGGHP